MKSLFMTIVLGALLLFPVMSMAQGKAVEAQVNHALLKKSIVNAKLTWSVTRYNKNKNEIFKGEKSCSGIDLPGGMLVSLYCTYPDMQVNEDTDRAFFTGVSFTNQNGKIQKLTPLYWKFPTWSPYVIIPGAKPVETMAALNGAIELKWKDKAGDEDWVRVPAVKVGKNVYTNFRDLSPIIQGNSITKAYFKSDKNTIPLSTDVLFVPEKGNWTIAHE